MAEIVALASTGGEESRLETLQGAQSHGSQSVSPVNSLSITWELGRDAGSWAPIDYVLTPSTK